MGDMEGSKFGVKHVVILGGNNQPTGQTFLCLALEVCLHVADAAACMPGVSEVDVSDTEHGSVPGLKCAQLFAQCGGASSAAAS